MRKTFVIAAMTAGFAAFAPTSALAQTVTRTFVSHGYTISCVVTYTELNGNGRIDLLKELLSISDISCTVTKNS